MAGEAAVVEAPVSPYKGVQIVLSIEEGTNSRLVTVAEDHGDELTAKLPDGTTVRVPWNQVLDFTGFQSK